MVVQPAPSLLCDLAGIIGSIWLQNLILLTTATIGLGSYILSSRHERRRATVDVLLSNLGDKEAIAALSRVHDLIKAGLDIPHLISDAGVADRRTIFSVLNRYEFMASGLKTGAFDKTVYKRMYYSSVVNDWRDLYEFVHAYRKYKELWTIYQDFEALANEWALDPLISSGA